ncbi:MAG: hypothetical protein E7311_01735 [Clostridiales bacterium]|nr:hypothetical protein [Clostridiales bacterium]
MSMGPMKKRMMLSFFIGFLIMLLVAVIGAVIFFNMYSALKEELANAKQHFTYVLVATEDYEADGNTELNINSFILKEVNTNTLPNEYYTSIQQTTANSFEEAQINSLDPHCLLWPSAERKVYPKIDIPAGTIVTMDMLWDETEKITKDTREQEFNMILLPSMLKEGDYVDVRLLLPTGNDFTVAPFLRVKKVTEGTVWFDLKELDTQYISSAIIESYLTKGSMLYAVKYSEPTLQEKAQRTYAVLPEVYSLLSNPNFNTIFDPTELNEIAASQEEKRALISAKLQEFLEQDPEKSKEELVEKIEERIEKQQEERSSQIASGLLVSDSLGTAGDMSGEEIVE